MIPLPGIAAAAALALLAACAAAGPRADPASDEPESRRVSALVAAPPTYGEALRRWRSAADVNAWIGARFEYDRARAMALSETQRARGAGPAIHAPADFYARPSGICVDLSRFAVETLRAIDPEAKPAYVMIEFNPAAIAGNTLRRHWVATYEHRGQRYFFADSKRPGHVAGPYASTADYIRDYAAYRGREIVAFRERDGYQRRGRAPATRQR